jgi:divalent metal cation (Fe/Co/Zn/Cd) transporter
MKTKISDSPATTESLPNTLIGSCSAGITGRSRIVVRLQTITLAWMFIECSVALTAAWRASSPALLAFGSDSFVELLSAGVVLMQFTSWVRIKSEHAARAAGILLFVLAGIIAMTSAAALLWKIQPNTSVAGIVLTAAALFIMPALSSAKRRNARITGDRALAADAVQSSTCAYLAAITLFGLAMNAVFRIHWVDPAGALAAVPILCIEGRRALREEHCGCC